MGRRGDDDISTVVVCFRTQIWTGSRLVMTEEGPVPQARNRRARLSMTLFGPLESRAGEAWT